MTEAWVRSWTVVDTIGEWLWRTTKAWVLAPERASDEALMGTFIRGDNEAFGQLVERHELELYRYCMGYLQNPSQARDTVRELLSRVRVAPSAADGPHGFKAWLLGMAQDRCIRAILRERAMEAGLQRDIA